MNKQTPIPPPETVMTSRTFNQDTGKAKKAARNGPVIITDRGEPSYVLLSIEAYRKLAKPFISLLDAIADPDPRAAEIDLDAWLPKREIVEPRPLSFDEDP